ncbi:MAG: ATP synthase F1 subunit epsilon [Pseudomonadota bacterium]
MADRIAFDLVSPEKLLMSEDCEMVVAPGEEGDFGVLLGHAPFLTTLRMGAIAIHEGGAVKQTVYVSGGFAEATPDRFTILANRAISAEAVDKAALQAERDGLGDGPTADAGRAFIDMVLAQAA